MMRPHAAVGGGIAEGRATVLLPSHRAAGTVCVGCVGRRARRCVVRGLGHDIRPTPSSTSTSRLTLGKDASPRAARRLTSASAASPSGVSGSPEPLTESGGLAQALWKFVRPHTIRGTVLGSAAIVSKVLIAHPDLVRLSLVPRALAGVAALLCANAFIVGINQVYDVDIDTINKPWLPIAAGEMSENTAWIACLSAAAAGLALAHGLFGGLIAGLYTCALVIGAAYSVPPLRLKQRPVPAMACIVLCRGFLLNFGVHHATCAALGLPFAWDPPVLFITALVTAFAVVISATKDLADVKGDKQEGVQTFATQVGVDKVSQCAAGALVVCYAVAVALGLANPQGCFRPWAMVVGHGLLAIWITVETCRLHFKRRYDEEGIKAFYRAIWNLFYAEYALYPFI